MRRLGGSRQDHDRRVARSGWRPRRPSYAGAHHRPRQAARQRARPAVAGPRPAAGAARQARPGRRRRQRLPRRHDARPEASLRRDRRALHPGPRDPRAHLRQPHLPADLVHARRLARIRGHGQAERNCANAQIRPHHPRHAAHRQRARLPRRSRAADRGHRLAGDPVVHQALPGGGPLLAQGGGAGRGLRHAPAGALRRLGVPRGHGALLRRLQRHPRRLPRARPRGLRAAARPGGRLRAGVVGGAALDRRGHLLLRSPGAVAHAAGRVRGQPCALGAAVDPTLADIDSRQVQRLTQRSAAKVPVVQVPFFDQDIYDVAGLSQMVRHLVGP